MSLCVLHIIPSSFSVRSPTPSTGFRTSPGDILARLHPLLTAPAARLGSAALPQGGIPVTQPKALPTARGGDHGANPAPCPRAGPGRWDAGDECAHGAFPAKLAEADNSLLPKVNLSSVLALGCGTRWDGHSPVWNRLVWDWEWEAARQRDLRTHEGDVQVWDARTGRVWKGPWAPARHRHITQAQALLTPAAGFPLAKRPFNVDAIPVPNSQAHASPGEEEREPPCDLGRGDLAVPAPALSLG